MSHHIAVFPLLILSFIPALHAEDMEDVSPDLIVPEVTDESPAPGRRVRQQNEDYADTEVYHVLYLPTDWAPGKKYPVIVEYAGNRYKSIPGTVESSHLGYGISGGRGVIWACLPYVNTQEMRNQLNWWGDVDATVEYCKHTVARICREYGGDPEKVFIAGFSRGAIACNFLGMHDDEIAALWRGFICHSHYDGVRNWGYAGADRESAVRRLARLDNRPQWISHEKSVRETKQYLAEVYPDSNFTFLLLPFPDHTDTWVLRDVPERKVLRKWFRELLEDGG